MRSVGDPGDSGAFDGRTVLIGFARLVQPGDQVIHIRYEIFAGGNDDGMFFRFVIIDAFHDGRFAVAFHRRLNKGPDVGGFHMLELVEFADHAGLSVVLQQTDGTDILIRRIGVKLQQNRSAAGQQQGQNVLSCHIGKYSFSLRSYEKNNIA